MENIFTHYMVLKLRSKKETEKDNEMYRVAEGKAETTHPGPECTDFLVKRETAVRTSFGF